MITIKGTLERFTYQNPQNYYTIAKLCVSETNEPVTLVGFLAGVAEGESLEVSGKWVCHPKYGDQFRVESCQVLLPAGVSGIRKYLGSGMIQGIGRSLADKIVDHFREQTLEIIENEPERLCEVRGIGAAKQAVIEKAWNTHHAVRRVMQFLRDNDVSVFHAAAILRAYGNRAMEVLEHEPYKMTRDIPGLGFDIADMIAMKTGISKKDINRLKACVIHVLNLLEHEGHVYGIKHGVIESCSKISGVGPDEFEPVIETLELSGEIKTLKHEDECRVYSALLYQAESGIASRIKAMLSFPCRPCSVTRELILEKILTSLAIKLSEEQLDVVTHVMQEKVVVITGGPGTGKTTLIRALCEVFRLENLKTMLGAPTGRAARRLSQVTGGKAFTLHRILGFDHENNRFEKNFSDPLDTDVFVLDEASMVDTVLMYRLLEALPANAGLIIVGDTFQLPSVGPGNVLADIIESGQVKVFSLTKIFRQARKSPIVMHAHRIRKGQMPELKNPAPGPGSEFYFIENFSGEKVADTIVELCAARIPDAFPDLGDIQVLTPMHKGQAGTINLNRQLQKALNPRKSGVSAGGMTFMPGDKVMHLKNNYEKDVFNGDIGVVSEISKSGGQVFVNYDDRIVEYGFSDLEELTLAYAISVHKSQGSEYSGVILALTMAHFPLLQRNLLYTAMTRGKKLVIIVGSSKAFKTALDNNKTFLRLSGLKHMLKT
jgi:exodeoxyribonuclease V alpha subunit